MVRGEGDQRREEVEEQSRDETNRNAGIASVSGELMRKITSRRGGGAARAPREVARRQLSSQTATGRSPSEVTARPSDLTILDESGQLMLKWRPPRRAHLYSAASRVSKHATEV